MFLILAAALGALPGLVWGLDQTTCNGNVGRSNSYAVLGDSINGCVACLNFETAGYDKGIYLNTDAPNVWMSQGCFSKTIGAFKSCGDAYGYSLGAGNLFEGTDSPQCSSEDIENAAINVLAQVQAKYKLDLAGLKLSIGPDTGMTQSLYNILSD